jgi:transposase-like protein
VSTTGVMDTSGSRRRAYRTWPASLKREIVEASLAPGASVSVVARRYDMNSGHNTPTKRARFAEARDRGAGQLPARRGEAAIALCPTVDR